MNRKTLLKRPTKTSTRSQKEFLNGVQVDLLRRVDEQIVHQHVIRRFKLRHEADFNKLVQMRRELDGILRSAGPENPQRIITNYPRTELLCCCMNFLGDQKNLRYSIEKEPFLAQRRLCSDLDEILLRHASGIRLEDEDVANLVETLKKFSSDINDVACRQNYLRYYSLFGLTSLVSGLKFYTHYINAKLGRHQIAPFAADIPLHEEVLWMFTTQSRTDDDFSALIATTCYRPLRTSKNIHIFGGSQHSISVNGTPLQNRLVLSVPTNETPDRIDDALREFREALVQEYIRNGSGYHSVNSPSFDDSIFMTQFAHEPCLIKDWDQLQSRIVGLWAWDMVCVEKQTVESASESVALELERIKKELGHKLVPYSADTVHRYYEYTAKEIGQRLPKKATESTKIDSFVTRSDVTLGSISQNFA